MKNFNIILSIFAFYLVISCSIHNEGKNILLIRFDTLYVSDSRYEVYTKLDTVNYGVMSVYDTNFGGKIEERFYINNKPIVFKKLSADTTRYAYSYLYNINDTLFPIGYSWYDIETSNKIQKLSTYFEINAFKTVKVGEPYNVEIIGNLGNFKDFQLRLTLGEIDSNLNLIKVDTIHQSKTRKLNFEIENINEGINIITGHLEYYDNDKEITNKFMYSSKVKVPYIFYLQFNVK